MTTEPTQMPLPLRCRPARRRHHWSDRHLRCCLACGRVWKPRRRKTCPHCHHDRLAFCLTCDRAWPEQNIRDRCTPPCEDLRRLVNAVPSPANGVMMCTGMDFLGADMPALIKEYAGKIHCVGFRDHSESWPSAREVPLGEGRVDFRAVVAALKEVGYKGIWAPEHLGRPRYDGEDLFGKGVKHIRGVGG